MMSFKGVRLKIDTKLRQTGSKMKITSTWSTRAAVRAMANDASESAFTGIEVSRTESKPKERPCGYRIVVQLVVQEAKDGHDDMQEDVDAEKHLPAAFVDHPNLELLAKVLGFEGSFGGICQRPLKTLKPPPLGLVPLKVAGFIATVRGYVRVLIESVYSV
jgi:hypothetical protein